MTYHNAVFKLLWAWALLLPLSMGGCADETPPDDDQDDGDDDDGDDDDDSSPAKTVVGAWWTKTDKIEVGWKLCADKRMYGFSKMGGFEFLDKGSWSGTTDIDVTWRSKDTTLGDTHGPDSATFEFDPKEDTLCCFDNTLMIRLDGEVVNSDCDPGW